MIDAGRYRLIRSRRRTISIDVTDEGVTVRAPYGLSEERIAAFLESKRAWIEQKCRMRTESATAFSRVRKLETLLDAGTERPVAFGVKKDGENEGGFFLRSERSVRSYFAKTRGDALPELLYRWSRSVGEVPADVVVRDFKARWGSCDAHRVIKLNWRLSMLPPDLRDYVLVHELCHLKELNHSARFWAEVERVCPEYRKNRHELRRYSFLTAMYR